MPAYKDEKRGTWYASFYYKDWTGKRKRQVKRGFPTKKAALEYERSELAKAKPNLNMPFKDLTAKYKEAMKHKIREHTWKTKNNIIDQKILPYFGEKKVCEITADDVTVWQNMIQDQRDKDNPFSPTYLKSIHNQLSAILNFAVKKYKLNENVAATAGNMGKGRSKEMLFWTKEEYLKFIDSMMTKPVSYYAFEMLYWCGLRVGELLALTKSDFDFKASTVSITKSYQRLNKKDVITDPKTPKSNRVIAMPDFLCEEMQEYINSIYGLKKDDRLFQFTKSYLHHEMTRGCKEQGVKRIRIHDLRHSHVSLLIELGFTPPEIADRMGHETIEITLRYAHMFPNKQKKMAEKLDIERNGANVKKEEGREEPLEKQGGSLPNVPAGE
ncbi:MAG: site-specific integrase [Ruminiclostridium sp.]|nr:site-specific integrase [Ruminiclostridium sp.]